MYMNGLPVGGKVVAPVFPVGDFVLVVPINFVILPLLFLLLHIHFQKGNTTDPILPTLITVVSVICILLYLVRLYVSLPTDTLR